jgi:AbrB family looped-hinge helix DNA binding protein
MEGAQDICKSSLTYVAVSVMEASTTKVSSKGQVVIPANIRKAANIKEGERLLAIALGDTIILKKIFDKTFEETFRPIWDRARRIGLTEEDINAIIEEAKAQGSS